MHESLLNKLKRVRLKDLFHFLLFLLALLPARFLKKKRPELWLLSENGEEARDNGYFLYRYLKTQRPEVDAVYAIRSGSKDYPAVAALGETVEFGSFRHWMMYLAARVNVSSQKHGGPNAAVCYLTEVHPGFHRTCRVFLQHGVSKDDLPFVHYGEAKFSLFVTSAKDELDYVRANYGYPENAVQLFGLTRFDRLCNLQPEQDLVLILPTWRMYLQRLNGQTGQSTFLESDYYAAWNSLLKNGKLDALLRQYGKRAVFCLHRNMEAYESAMTSPSERIRVLPWQQADVSVLLEKAAYLITDFSSVFMDFAYMERPMVLYQFDIAQYRDGHLPEGYFSYERDGFGPVCDTEEELLSAVEDMLKNGPRMREPYLGRAESFFPPRDGKCCERTCDGILALIRTL